MKNMIKGLLGLLLCTFQVNTCLAQKPVLTFEHFNTRNGLSQNLVRCMVQDYEGLMWFATNNGLNKFDGYSFSIYKTKDNDAYSVSSNMIRTIYEDKQRNLWIGTNEGLDLYDRSKDRFIRLDNFKEEVNAIYEDRQGSLWVSTNHGEVYQLDRDKRLFTKYLKTEKNYYVGGFSQLYEDSRATLWYVNENDIITIDRKNQKAVKKNLGIPSPTSIFEDSQQNIWFTTRGFGLQMYNQDTKAITQYKNDPTNPNSLLEDNVLCMVEDAKGLLWIGTDHGGLNIFDPKTRNFFHYLTDGSDLESLNSNSIYSIYRDRNNNIWLGTFNGGVNLCRTKKFTHYKNTGGNGRGLNHNNLLSMCEDRQGYIWIGTDGGGLNVFDKKHGTFTYYMNAPQNPHSLSNNYVTNVIEDRSGTIWVGFWDGGVDKFDRRTKQFLHFRHDAKDSTTLNSNNAWKLFEDRQSNLWVGTTDGLDLLDRKTHQFRHFNVRNGLSHNIVLNIFEDKDGDLWIATGKGLNLMDRKTGRFTTFLHNENDPKSISNNGIHSLFNDSKGRLWICTQNGLNLMDKSSRTFKKYTEKEGLASNVINSIHEDDKGNLWISSLNGLAVFNPDKNTFKNYNVGDGLQDNEFKQNASLQTQDGKMLFGGNNGFNIFHPDSIQSNPFTPAVVITDFRIFNKSIPIGTPNSPLQNHISQTKELILTYQQSVFSFDFAALNYVVPSKNQYAYQMEGFEKEWNYVGNKRSATYTNLDAGKYVFRVKASNNDGVWNETGASIKITITPPFWKTWWFSIFLLTTVTGSALAYYRGRMNGIQAQKAKLEKQVQERTADLQHANNEVFSQKEELQSQAEFLQIVNSQLQEQQQQAEKARHEAEEANRAKSTFLATMSHEIRTPMNGVIGMASLLAETTQTSEQQEYTETIRSCGENLLNVINDILDFSKIESGNMELDSHNFDLRTCIEEVLDVFATKASQIGLDLVYQIDPNVPTKILGDALRLRQVMLNLVSNAIKFTQQGEIFLGVRLQQTNPDSTLMLGFEVCDTGIGIPADKLGRLFKSFSQVDSSTTRKYGGTGLGLVICEKLIALMGGRIEVASQPGKGTTFRFSIQVQASTESVRTYVNYNLTGLEGKRILVIDDNATNRCILQSQLEQWQLVPVMAESGAQALILLNQEPAFDLVITDMQMPEMDGVALAQAIREQYPNLPLLLLSSIGQERNQYPAELFSAILNKPVKQHILCKHIHQQLKQPGKSVVEVAVGERKLSVAFAQQYPLRILIAEDNLVNQKLAVRILNKLGYQPALAADGLQAVEQVSAKEYDLVLMDVQMPDMDGLEATRAIRQQLSVQPLIVAMTANAMQGDREECLKAGMNDYLSKPIKLEELVKILEKWATHLQDKFTQ